MDPLSRTQAALLTDLRGRYGSRYNRGRDVGLESGYGAEYHWLNTARWRESARGVRKAIDDFMTPGARGPVLDLGCGPGVMTAALRDVGLDAYGVDLGEDIRDPRCVVGNGIALPFRGLAFAVVVALDVIEHVPDDLQPLLWRELRRVTGRLLIATVPTRAPHYRWTCEAGPRNHYLCLPPEGWGAVFIGAGFEVVVEGERLSRLGMPFNHGTDNYPFALRRNHAGVR